MICASLISLFEISTPTISSPCTLFFPSLDFKKLLNFSFTFPLSKFNLVDDPPVFPNEGNLNLIFFNFSKIFFGSGALEVSNVVF